LREKLLEMIEKSVSPLLSENGYEICDLTFSKEGGNNYLRFFIDKENGVDINDCEACSNLLSKWLDENDPIPEAYFLEVSSPGIERPLKRDKDFIRFKGEWVRVGLYKAIEGEKEIIGKLGDVDDTKLNLILVFDDDSEETVTIERKDISQVKLCWEDEED